MQHVFPAKVDQAVDDWSGGISIWIRRIEHRRVSSWHHWVQWSDGVGYFKGEDRDNRSDRKVRVFQRAYPHRVLPTQFSGVRWLDDIIPGYPIQHLYIIEVEMYWVGIHTIMGDFPYLRAVGADRNGCHICRGG